jgi:hypothetical protein
VKVHSRAAVADAGSRVVSVNERSEIEIVELPSLVTWTLPRLYQATPWLNISPLGGRIYQSLGYDSALFTIPEPASDFKAWLDGLTNASDDEQRVVWPFSPPL